LRHSIVVAYDRQMSNRVRDLIEEFASKLESILKDDVRRALATVGLGIAGGRPARANGHNAARSKGAKRDRSELQELSERFVAFVTKNPGLRIEEISRELGTTTKNLALPIRKLIAEGRLRTTGHKRSTTYAVGGKARGSTAKRKGAKK
jgi:hypothetical protein